MFKILFKKQINELFRNYFVNPKTGKVRSTSQVLMTVGLFAFILVSVGAAFSGMLMVLAQGMLPGGHDAEYFALLGLLAMMIGVFGSVFNSFSFLYLAKDNDTMLSLPIKPSVILSSKMMCVYLLSVVYQLTVFVPGYIQYYKYAAVTASSLLSAIAVSLLSGMIVLAVVCLLGFFIAMISSRVKHKKYIQLVLVFAFFILYYAGSIKLNTILTTIASNIDSYTGAIKKYAYPIYLLGRASAGNIRALIVFALISIAAAALTCLILSKTYINIVTTQRGSKKKLYREKAAKAGNVKSALLGKELKRFTGSVTYMMNSGFGLFIMLVLAIAAMIKGRSLISQMNLSASGFMTALPGLAVSIVCMIVSMCCISAPSVSLEGKNIWVVKSLPISTKDILGAKMKLQTVLTAVPALLLTAAISYVIRADLFTAVLMIAAVICYILFFSAVGVALNLKSVDLNWTNEVIPIKQGKPIFFAMFGGWIVSMLPAASALLFANYRLGFVPALIVYAVLTPLVIKWVNGRGAELFEDL